jgi:hypothetical protein
MSTKFSAYLSMFNDWDILPAALRSVAQYVDELVVVDGAYDWMVPYLKMLGRDPLRSDPRVYDAIEASGIPFRVFAGTWKNEIEKRQSGYDACTHDYICRIDADEIMFFSDNALQAALSSGVAVGEMLMPCYVAPGWISRHKDLPHIERQCFLFDRRQVSSEIHLNYLWLVLPADTLPSAAGQPYAIYPEPLAFNAHLTGWRTPETAVNRAAFYVFNRMRKRGVPWISELGDRPLADMRRLLSFVPADAFRSAFRRGRIAMGMIESRSDRLFLPTLLKAEQEETFTGLFGKFLDSLTIVNRLAAAEDQVFLTSQPTLLDLSTPASRAAVAPNGTVSIRVSTPLISATAQLQTYAGDEPNIEMVDLPVSISGTDFHVELPGIGTSARPILRQCLEFHVRSNEPNPSQRFRALT